MTRICMIGTGYVGLTTGAGLSDFGNQVVCVDIDESKIKSLQQGKLPIYEHGLQELVDRNVQAGRLHFSLDIPKAIQESEVVFIAVGTPPAENGEADLSAVFDVAKTIGENLNGYKVICTKSTVPVGTGYKIKDIIEKHRPEPHPFDVVSNPEFLREGSAVRDFLIPNRVVVGVESERAAEVMRRVYRTLYINETPMVITNIPTAELIKYASNAFLAVKISFINEIANLADVVGADVHVIARAMGLDGRISSKFLHPGPGFGGSCFPKDTRALVATAEEYGVKARVVAAAIETNEHQREVVFQKLKELLPDLEGKRIAVLGLAFKPNTDDVRESPAIPLIKRLIEEGAEVIGYDPLAGENMRRLYFPDLPVSRTLDGALQGADAAIVLTDWHELRGLDLEHTKKLLNQPVIVDARNVLSVQELKRLGYRYRNIGRSAI